MCAVIADRRLMLLLPLARGISGRQLCVLTGVRVDQLYRSERPSVRVLYAADSTRGFIQPFVSGGV